MKAKKKKQKKNLGFMKAYNEVMKAKKADKY